MHANMFPRVPLTEDMGALEMPKRNVDRSFERRGIGGAQFRLVGVSECLLHVAGSYRTAVPKSPRTRSAFQSARSRVLDIT
jgi:hypothetical protein